MSNIFIFLHIVVCVLLILIILMQSGRGGGLTEAFASAESVFGAQTSGFLIKGTTIFASLFLVTCLSLAFLSSRKTESIMAKKAAAEKKAAEPSLPAVATPAVPTTPDVLATTPQVQEPAAETEMPTMKLPEGMDNPVEAVPEAAPSAK